MLERLPAPQGTAQVSWKTSLVRVGAPNHDFVAGTGHFPACHVGAQIWCLLFKGTVSRRFLPARFLSSGWFEDVGSSVWGALRMSARVVREKPPLEKTRSWAECYRTGLHKALLCVVSASLPRIAFVRQGEKKNGSASCKSDLVLGKPIAKNIANNTLLLIIYVNA